MYLAFMFFVIDLCSLLLSGVVRMLRLVAFLSSDRQAFRGAVSWISLWVFSGINCYRWKLLKGDLQWTKILM